MRVVANKANQYAVFDIELLSFICSKLSSVLFTQERFHKQSYKGCVRVATQCIAESERIRGEGKRVTLLG